MTDFKHYYFYSGEWEPAFLGLYYGPDMDVQGEFDKFAEIVKQAERMSENRIMKEDGETDWGPARKRVLAVIIKEYPEVEHYLGASGEVHMFGWVLLKRWGFTKVDLVNIKVSDY